MIQDITPERYDNHYVEQLPGPEDWLLVYRNGEVLCRLSGNEIVYPKVKESCQDALDMAYLFSISF